MILPPSNENIMPVIDHLPGYFVLKSTDSIYCFANKNAARVLGFNSADSLIGKTDHDLQCAASEYADLFVQEDKLTLQHGKLKFISLFCYAQDEWKTCIYEKSTFKDSRGNISGISCYVTDITDCQLTDMTRFLLKTDCKYQYELQKQQFSYLLNDNYFNDNLTPRETECLFFILRGKSSKAIAKILNLSVKTIEYYTEQLKYKIDCANKSELIEKSLSKGYLNILPKSFINNQH